jgi:demethylmenaquinone methyltransferase / 2-methoxy-6-polyprenyl-1,4-benzoquinol methylase
MADTHFGYQTVDETDKTRRVRGVFDSVAPKYDLMNDLLSGGLHRAWKAYTVAVAAVRPGDRVLDIAGGTGDLARAFAAQVGDQGRVVLTDINEAMLRVGRDRLLDAGLALPTVVCDAERLPWPDGSFDLVSVAFGLRNMTHKELAAGCWCWSFPPRRRRFGRCTTSIPSRSCRCWAAGWPATARVTATWRSRSACTPTRRR